MEIQTAPIELERPPEVILPEAPPPVVLLPIEWVVITPDRLPTMEDWVIFGLAPDDYERLSQNQAELLRWIIEAKRRIDLAKAQQPQ